MIESHAHLHTVGEAVTEVLYPGVKAVIPGGEMPKVTLLPFIVALVTIGPVDVRGHGASTNQPALALALALAPSPSPSPNP